MKPTNLPEWQTYLEVTNTSVYLQAFKGHAPIIHEGKKYFIHEVKPGALILVEVDEGILAILDKPKPKAKAKVVKRKVPKDDDFWCAGHQKRELRSQVGKIYGRRCMTDPYRYYCKAFVIEYNIQRKSPTRLDASTGDD